MYQMVHLFSFSGTSLPTTVAIQAPGDISMIAEVLAGFSHTPNDKNLLFVQGAPLRPSSPFILSPPQELGSATSNPYDPILFFLDEDQQSLTGRQDHYVAYSKRGRLLNYVNSGSFRITSFEWRNAYEMPAGRRFVELLATQLLAELFVSVSAVPSDLPVFLRRGSGQIDIRMYGTFEAYKDALCPSVLAALWSFIRVHPQGLLFENLMRLARGYSLAFEIGNMEKASCRWEQLLNSKEFSAEQLTRQFEIELIADLVASVDL